MVASTCHPRYILVISVMTEAEIRKSMVPGQPGPKVDKIPFQQKKKIKIKS
jgi:hypothetical protein